MKQSLQQMLSTKSIFDFSSGTLQNSKEEIPQTTFYKSQVKKEYFIPTPKASSQKPKKIIFDWTSIKKSDRPQILLNTLLKDVSVEPPLSRTNYSTWNTSHKKKIEISYSPPIKKSVLLIRAPTSSQPGVGHYELKFRNRIRGSVQLHKSQEIFKLHQNQYEEEQNEKGQRRESCDDIEKHKVSEQKLIKFVNNENCKLKSKLVFQQQHRDLDDHPFKKTLDQFNIFKNRIKILKDLKYLE